jgi:hypothetical protein
MCLQCTWVTLFDGLINVCGGSTTFEMVDFSSVGLNLITKACPPENAGRHDRNTPEG